MASRQNPGQTLVDLMDAYGWRYRSLHRQSGVSESLIRKYANNQGKRPEVEYVWRIARVFGSRDGAKLLFAYGFDAQAEKLAAEGIDAADPTSAVEELPQPEGDSYDERIRRLEEAVEEILRELVPSNRDTPDYVGGPTPVTDINRERLRRQGGERLSRENQFTPAPSADKAS